MRSTHADTTHGPLGAHARVLVGVYGDGTPDGTQFEFIDPRDGRWHRVWFMEFIESFEREARTAENLEEIRWQVLHLPSIALPDVPDAE